MTSVGATQLVAAAGLVTEEAAAFSSGGFSNVFPAPPYQQAAVSSYIYSLAGKANKGRFNESGRGYPDVAALGVNFEIIVGGAEESVDGTSASSPTFASVIALLNDRRKSAGKNALGFLNPFLYSAAGASALNDITVGSNPGCESPGFFATQGWDPVRLPYTRSKPSRG